MRPPRFGWLPCLLLSAFCASVSWASDGGGKMTATTQSEKARALFEQGLAKYDRARPKEATALFQQAIEADPKFALGHLFRGLAGDTNASIRRAAELSPGASEPERLFIAGWKAQLDSQLLKAVEYTEQAVKLLPTDARLRTRLAQLYNATSRREEALAEFKRAAASDPKFAPVYGALGEYHAARGEFSESLAARETYARLLPGEAEPYQQIAHTYQQMQRFDKAVDYYTRALKIDPDYINVYRRRGDARFFSGDVAGARADYRAGLERAKGADRPGLLFAAAFTYVHEGQIDEAAKYYGQAIAIAEAEHEWVMINSGWDALGRSYLEAGRLVEAADAYRKGYEASKRSPDYSETDKLLWEGRYRHARGRILAKIGEFDAAMQHAEWIRAELEKAGNPSPAYTKSYHYLVGYILLEKRDYKGALEHLKQASTDDVFIKLLTARAYAGSGDPAAAGKLMREIAGHTLGSVPSSIARPQALRWLKDNGVK
ncbi:MAG: tetratricopeptide repeat protein [Acidobacteria bacterium]|nr:tetratricopeptide repeat protein [Acidobacteriota bacterium]MCA1640857.1 tetratricopeptide repeat protein [Acidobacteriota bacterium]